MYSVGSLVPVTFAVRNANGALTNAATVNLMLTQPDGTVITPAITNPPTATGIYTYDYLATQAGRHTWYATTSGPITSYGPIVFHVTDIGPGGIIGLDDTKEHLNLDLTDTTYDAELLAFLDAATPVVEDIVGPVVARSRTEVHDGGEYLVLNHSPVISVATLVPVHTGGTTYSPATLDVDTATGIVRRLDGGRFVGPLRVTYVPGRRVVPPNIIHGTKEIIRHMWDTQRGRLGSRPGLGDDEYVTTSSGYTVPRRAMELLAPHRKGPIAA